MSNIASWNYPMSVLVHAMLVQALAGNAVIAKTPTDGGVACLTLACALAAREGIPVTLVSGSGGELSEALVRAPEIGCVSFVGGRDTGAAVATAVADLGKRHILEQEGLNTWGIWNYTDWDALTAVDPQALRLRQAALHGLPALRRPAQAVRRRSWRPTSRRCAPCASGTRSPSSTPTTRYPQLDFGPVINAAKAKELHDQVAEAIDRGAVPLHRGSAGRRAASCPARTPRRTSSRSRSSNPPPSSPLHHAEPFGPVDTIVLVDTEAELLAAMNASNGALVATLSTDDRATYDRLAPQIRAFKVGHGKPRSRGDRDELFGGFGASWRGAFVGGELLVRAVTEGPAGERLPGNFPEYQLMP